MRILAQKCMILCLLAVLSLLNITNVAAQGSEVSVDDVLWAVGMDMVTIPIPPREVVYAGFFITIHRKDQIEPFEIIKLGAVMSMDEAKLDGTARVAFGFGKKPMVDKDTELLVITGINSSRSAFVLDLEQYSIHMEKKYMIRWLPSELINVKLNDPIPILQLVPDRELRYDMSDIENLVIKYGFIVTLNLILTDYLPEVQKDMEELLKLIDG